MAGETCNRRKEKRPSVRVGKKKDAPAPCSDRVLEKGEQDDQGKQNRICRPDNKPHPCRIHLLKTQVDRKRADQEP